MLLRTNVRQRNYETYLELWEIGGNSFAIKRPFDPYFYARREFSVGETEKVEKILLSTLRRQTLWKTMFKNTRILRRSTTLDTIEDNVPYKQRVAIDLGFKRPSPLPSFESFDLEMDTKRGFPDPSRDKIIAISYEGEEYAKCNTIFDEPEYELIHWFIDTVTKRNPDVLCSYFGSFADWDWLSRRAAEHGIKLAVGRDGSDPFFIKRTYKSGKKVGEDIIVDIAGRVHFDVWKEVAQDQTLFGIKNRKLKTVAEWFGIPVIKVDRALIHELNAQRLRRYCQSDSHATEELAKIYIRNLFPLGDYLELPFNMVVERAPSHPSNYIYMKKFRELGIVADANNKTRYPEFAREGRKAYQGALISLMKAGVFFNIKHLDFKSMYPVINIVHNYSPESIYGVHIHRGVKMPEWVEYHGEKISVWDKYLGIITVKVNLREDSVTRQVLIEFMHWRDKIRKLGGKSAKIIGTEAFSQQWAVKVMMNSIPGYHGMGFARCGCYPIAAHTTGHGRFWIDKGTVFLLKQPNTTPIERDTDGIYYVSDNEYHTDVQELTRNLVPKQFDSEWIKVSSDTYEAGIFYEDKGYVLKKNNGKLLFHGSGLKGRHIPNLCDKAAGIIVNGIFDKDDVVGLLNNFGEELKGFPKEDFVMTTQIRRKPDSYSEKNQYGKLIKRCKKYGIQVRWGDELQYIKTVNKSYLPLGVDETYKIDYDYYMGRVANVVSRLLKVSHGYDAKIVLAKLRGDTTRPL